MWDLFISLSELKKKELVCLYWQSYENFLKVSNNRNKKRTGTVVTAIPKYFVVYTCNSAEVGSM